MGAGFSIVGVQRRRRRASASTAPQAPTLESRRPSGRRLFLLPGTSAPEPCRRAVTAGRHRGSVPCVPAAPSESEPGRAAQTSSGARRRSPAALLGLRARSSGCSTARSAARSAMRGAARGDRASPGCRRRAHTRSAPRPLGWRSSLAGGRRARRRARRRRALARTAPAALRAAARPAVPHRPRRLPRRSRACTRRSTPRSSSAGGGGCCSGQPSAALEAWIEPPAPSRRAGLSISCPAERVRRPSSRRCAPPIRTRGWSCDRSRTQRAAARRCCRLKQAPRLHPPHRDRGALRARRRSRRSTGCCARWRRRRSPALVQIALTPAPGAVERLARALFKHREAELSRGGASTPSCATARWSRTPSCAAASTSSTGRCSSSTCAWSRRDRATCERIASELRAEGAENRLVERGTAVRHGAARRSTPARRSAARATRCRRLREGVFASTELAALWHLPSVDYATVPFARSRAAARAGAAGDPAPARRARARCATRSGRSRSTPSCAARTPPCPGTVEQGKSSYLVATRRRGPAPRALRGDRARPQGRRRRGGGEPRAAGAHVHAARLRPPDLRLQPARASTRRPT